MVIRSRSTSTLSCKQTDDRLNVVREAYLAGIVYTLGRHILRLDGIELHPKNLDVGQN